MSARITTTSHTSPGMSLMRSTLWMVCLSLPLLGATSGEPGKCSVTKNLQTGGATISCTYGSSVEVGAGPAGDRGEKGKPGAAGTNSTVASDMDAGVTSIRCADGTAVSVQDGAPGAAGSVGAAGPAGVPCQVARDADAGMTTVTCGDGSTAFIPDGQAGAPGQPGSSCTAARDVDAGITTLACSDGTSTQVVDGRSSLVRMEQEPAGTNCPLGGLKVSSGLDADRDGELDPVEVSQVGYVCAAPASPTDAGTGSGGGMACGPSNCTGCCQDNKCVSGALVTACGKQGQVCSACTGAQECSQGMCQAAQTCNGCKDLLDNCQPGTAVSACGSAGAQCKTCSSGQSCINGACVGCDGTSCPDGCCDGTTCVSGAALTTAKCGAAGQACAACVNGAACTLGSQGGTCTGTGSGGGSGGGGGFGGGLGGGTGGGCGGCTDALGNCVTVADDQNCLPDDADIVGIIGGSSSVACVACAAGQTCAQDSLSSLLGLNLYICQ